MSNTSIIEMQGVAATSLDETLKGADLNWSPSGDKVVGMDTGILMPRKKLLYRSDTREPLGIVGQDYCPSEPKEFLQAQYEFAEFIQGSVFRAGFIGERSRAFAFINVGDINITKPKKKGDVLRAYIYSTDGWDGGTPRRSRLYVERLICSNGMTSRQLKANLWVSHTKGMGEHYGKRWKAFLQEIRNEVVGVKEEFTRLLNVPMDREGMGSFLKQLIPGESTMSENRRGQIVGLFESGEGNQGATRWDAYNAVTEFVTHHRSYRGNDATPVEVNRFLGVLETDTLSNRALAILNN